MGKGIYTNSELVETIIVDLNNLVKELLSGQYIQFCYLVSQMSQKLVNLRKTIDSDLKSRDEQIESLKQMLRDRGVELIDFDFEAGKENSKNE